MCLQVVLALFVVLRREIPNLCQAQLVVCYVSGKSWVGHVVIYHVTGMFLEAQFDVFYVLGKLLKNFVFT